MASRLFSIPKAYPLAFGAAFSTVKTTGVDLAVQLKVRATLQSQEAPRATRLKRQAHANWWLALLRAAPLQLQPQG